MSEEPRLFPKVVQMTCRCDACGGTILGKSYALVGVVNNKRVVIHDNSGTCLQKVRASLHLPMTDHQKFLSSRTVS